MTLRIALFFGAFALTANGPAGETKCSVATLHGRYVFAGQGFIEPIEPGIERVHYGIFKFDGLGKLSGRQSSSRGGRIGREQLEGTYAINSDCSGTLRFHHVGRPDVQTYGPGIETNWDLYVSEGGRMGHIIRMDEGTMAVRTFQK